MYFDRFPSSLFALTRCSSASLPDPDCISGSIVVRVFISMMIGISLISWSGGGKSYGSTHQNLGLTFCHRQEWSSIFKIQWEKLLHCITWFVCMIKSDTWSVKAFENHRKMAKHSFKALRYLWFFLIRTPLLDVAKFLLVISAATWLMARGTEQLGYTWHWHQIPHYIVSLQNNAIRAGPLIQGLIVTLRITAVSLVLAFIFGMVSTLRKDSTLPPVTSKKSIVFLGMVKIARFFKGLYIGLYSYNSYSIA